jgi:hypothetical protein
LHLRNPLLTLFSNLSYRADIVRIDRSAYKDFNITPGEVTMQGQAGGNGK